MSEATQTTLTNLVTLLLSITISFWMQAEAFVTWDTLRIMAIGLFAFVMDSIGGVLLAMLLNLFRNEKINPRNRNEKIGMREVAERRIDEQYSDCLDYYGKGNGRDFCSDVGDSAIDMVAGEGWNANQFRGGDSKRRKAIKWTTAIQ